VDLLDGFQHALVAVVDGAADMEFSLVQTTAVAVLSPPTSTPTQIGSPGSSTGSNPPAAAGCRALGDAERVAELESEELHADLTATEAVSDLLADLRRKHSEDDEAD
jgi:hypothetical protein